MTRISANAAILIALLGLVSFGFFYSILSADQMLELASNLVLAAALSIIITWARSSIVAVFSGGRDGSQFLLVAVTGIACAVLVKQGWINVFRWSGSPQWMRDLPLSAFTSWTLFWSLMLVILAPGTENGEIPAKNYVWAIISVSIGSLVTGIMIGLRIAPDVTF